MEPFIVGVDITDINCLYGRKRQLDILTSCAKRKSNAGIIGARRFGKTCILKSMEFFLNSKEDFNSYPIYFDVKTQTGIKKDTPAVYRSLAALLASKMCNDGILPEGDFKISRRCTLDVSNDMLDMLVQMKEWNSEYQKEAIFFLTNKIAEIGKYLLLLIDEIDYLLLEALESPSDFSRIRGAATDKESKLKFWVAGTSTWSSICTTIGSPELNCGLENVFLNPLTKEDFKKMWEHECSLINNTEQQSIFSSISDKIYHKTGGVPYYAKFVGSHMITNKIFKIPDYHIVRDYLTEILNNRFMSEIERSTLFVFINGQKEFVDTMPDGVSGLVSKGLIKVEDNTYSIGIEYLVDYLKARTLDSSICVNDKVIETRELETLVDQISRLRRNVNDKYGWKKPFVPSDEDPIEFNILKNICHDEATIDAFSGSLYKLYYEGSESGQTLPDNYKDHTFSNMVRALRHLYNHRDCTPTSMTTERLLALINHGKHPYKSDDYFCMQKTMLKAFHQELLNMLSNCPVSSCTEKINTTSKISSGTFRGGTFGKKSYVEQESTGFKQYIRTIREGENLIDGDRVEYNLCREPNKSDPTKSFWYAEDVHLKE